MHIGPRRAAALSTLCAGLVALVSCRWPAGGLLGSGRRAEAVKANTVCYECHIDFKGEELTEVHQKAGVACVRCHGKSKPHMEDEVRKTPADVTFRGGAMKVFCLTCHGPAKHLEVASHAAEEAKAPDAKRRTCTACHGEHELVDVEAAGPGKAQ